jgi:predicted SprT family Zn-dependent metalloprotease
MCESKKDDAFVYAVLAQHQVVELWEGREIITFLQGWAERFIVEFKLNIPEVVLGIDRLPANRYAQFRGGHNGLGLRGEITINSRYLSSREPWQVLGTLLHELLHGWQQAHGTVSRRNHHNIEFRDKAWELGLVVDRRGVTGYRADSEFKHLLASHGVVMPTWADRPTPRVKGSSKLKKWSCGCRPPVNVRVAVANFRARCLNCGCEFEQQDGR